MKKVWASSSIGWRICRWYWLNATPKRSIGIKEKNSSKILLGCPTGRSEHRKQLDYRRNTIYYIRENHPNSKRGFPNLWAWKNPTRHNLHPRWSVPWRHSIVKARNTRRSMKISKTSSTPVPTPPEEWWVGFTWRFFHSEFSNVNVVSRVITIQTIF